MLEDVGPDILAFTGYQLTHLQKIWSNSSLERPNKEIRGRTHLAGIVSNRPAARRLVRAVLVELRWTRKFGQVAK